MCRFNEISSRNQLADCLGVPRSKLAYLLFIKKTENLYTTFEIPKKSGGSREINAPQAELKNVQRKLSDALQEYQRTYRKEQGINAILSHAFEKEKSIITNAKIHRNKRYVLNIDLQAFFTSFHFGRVRGFFEKDKNFLLPYEVAVTIAQIACYNGHLPQGSPCSPIITNLICNKMDIWLLQLAKAYKLDYTRYADDITFSTNRTSFLDEYDEFIEQVTSVIAHSGFAVNEKKTRLQFRDSRQEVTGLVVNKKISVKREYIKKTRAMAHQLYQTNRFTIDGEESNINQLEGRFAFIHFLTRYNNKIDKGKHDSHNLSSCEKQFRNFIFFKTFIETDRPVIITEGKTDIRYIKAALKKHYAEFPSLVERDDNGTFRWKVSFFKRTDKWQYFFGMAKDGADTINNICAYFVGDPKGNLYKRFNEKYGSTAKSPIVFLFDNETQSDRPLKKFIKNNKLTDRVDELKSDLCIELASNVFLFTNPLVEGKDECEIEDLFPQEVLDIELGGKTFSRKKKYDTDKYYGKDIFSKYIYANYAKIDFNGFIPLLTALEKVAKQAKP